MSCDVCRGTNSSRCPVCGEQQDIVYCPECRGLGLKKCFAVSIRSGKVMEVTAETYMGLPETEDEARVAGKKYYRHYADECGFCGGTGEVWQDSHGNYHRMI